MALNPPLANDGLPCKVSGEIFVLQRENMEFEVQTLNGDKNFGKKSGKGYMYMTSCRIVFVNKDHQKSAFKAFDIPLSNLRKESFEQPVFGSNYLAGQVLPLFNLIPSECKFKLWFKAGGCGTFLKMIDNLLRQVRKNRNQQQQGPDQRFMDDIVSGNIRNNQALFDPNDPSVIYMTQPTQQYNPQQHGNFYGNNAPNNPYYQNQNQFQQPPQNQFSQPPQFNPPPPQQNQQFNAPPQQNQFNAPPQQNQFNAPPQQNSQYQPYQPSQNGGQFQQFNSSQQYQNNPASQQNFDYDAQMQQRQQQLNTQQVEQPQQQQKYFGFWGPSLQNNQQQPPQYAPQQPQQGQQAFQGQPHSLQGNQQEQPQQYQPQPNQQQQFQQYNPQQNNNVNNNYPSI